MVFHVAYFYSLNPHSLFNPPLPIMLPRWLSLTKVTRDFYVTKSMEQSPSPHLPDLSVILVLALLPSSTLFLRTPHSLAFLLPSSHLFSYPFQLNAGPPRATAFSPFVPSPRASPRLSTDSHLYMSIPDILCALHAQLPTPSFPLTPLESPPTQMCKKYIRHSKFYPGNFP